MTLHVPAIVNLALAAELYLKSILVDGGSYPADHRLLVLFEALPSGKRLEVIKRCDQEGLVGADLLDFLAKDGEAFWKWRYAFETDSLSIGYHNLQVFTQALRRSIVEANPGMFPDIEPAVPPGPVVEGIFVSVNDQQTMLPCSLTRKG